MKTRLIILLALLTTILPVRADDAGFAKVYLRNLEEQVAVAKEKTDAMYAWLQCEQTLKSLEETVAKLPAADRAAYLAKIEQYKPLVTAGAARNRANMITRRIRDTLQSARDDIAAGNNKPAILQEAYFDRLDGYFAEKDLSALPAEELKKLKEDYEAVKKSAAK
jgi:hypothetical protein